MGSDSSFQCGILRENSADWVAGQPSFPAEPSLSSARLSDFLVVLWVGAGEEEEFQMTYISCGERCSGKAVEIIVISSLYTPFFIYVICFQMALYMCFVFLRLTCCCARTSLKKLCRWQKLGLTCSKTLQQCGS